MVMTISIRTLVTASGRVVDKRAIEKMSRYSEYYRKYLVSGSQSSTPSLNIFLSAVYSSDDLYAALLSCGLSAWFFSDKSPPLSFKS